MVTQAVDDGIVVDAVSRVFSMGGADVVALARVDIEVRRGEAVAVVGPSGSGKSTLLHLIAGLDRPTAGRISVFGQRLWEMSEAALTRYRATTLGYVFEDARLLPGLTALENVVAARLPWGRRQELAAEARELLEGVGLGDRVDHPPDRLSGGERQRVSLARALLGRPRLLLADEPTGNLDGTTTEDLLGLLGSLRRTLDLTLVLATHNVAVAASADRVLRLAAGRIVDGAGPEHAPELGRRVRE
jgi:predicted ABC-type transport system involved in lysophospholipase L1 biosynthesis ATPase subunit